MATVNLGRLRLIWRGEWAVSTAYVLDDVVRQGVSTYICTNAHTSTSSFTNDIANWDLMAIGSDGLDELADIGVWLDNAGGEGPAGPSANALAERYGAMTIFNASNLNMRTDAGGGVQIITIPTTGEYFIKCAGAQGGGYQGGNGGIAWGTVDLT